MARSVFGNQSGPASESGQDKVDQKPMLARRKPIIKGGAASSKYINAATQGGADRTYQEISVDQIQESPIRDRINVEEDLDSLVESIRANGQQIPILVRVVQGEKPYEIVVGRRRLAAHRRLALPRIKAFVAKLDDREAFIAQGIENSARLETSYIERARAAAQGVNAGYDQKDIAEFLNISRTLINFMIKSYQAVGEELVLSIGPARGVGRRKWDTLVTTMARHGISPDAARALVNEDIADSVERFEALLYALQIRAAKNKPPSPAPKASRRNFFGGGVSTVRKPQQLVVNTRKNMPPEILEKIDAKIVELLAELEAAQEG
ncbi:ParB/RepB/Spo0J family partition protein [Puniceibacterium sediminis]|uniref:Chromosome partitioning protein, ParB family n=1 Tax=Puniceibacterium sediminis TaxID=1608407 RepID=A0A238Y8A4_9RHOB|nr:ParB/RepB/Spo0J family partition protein [Puniceibacterium sediminis]SNR67001.1 chromosome partitioning protein, ParB family [Puniceibacterium sediminis]